MSIQTQNEEFAAARKFADALKACLATAVIDDDYPTVRDRYEAALTDLIKALQANERLPVASHVESLEVANSIANKALEEIWHAIGVDNQFAAMQKLCCPVCMGTGKYMVSGKPIPCPHTHNSHYVITVTDGDWSGTYEEWRRRFNRPVFWNHIPAGDSNFDREQEIAALKPNFGHNHAIPPPPDISSHLHVEPTATVNEARSPLFEYLHEPPMLRTTTIDPVAAVDEAQLETLINIGVRAALDAKRFL